MCGYVCGYVYVLACVLAYVRACAWAPRARSFLNSVAWSAKTNSSSEASTRPGMTSLWVRSRKQMCVCVCVGVCICMMHVCRARSSQEGASQSSSDSVGSSAYTNSLSESNRSCMESLGVGDGRRGACGRCVCVCVCVCVCLCMRERVRVHQLRPGNWGARRPSHAPGWAGRHSGKRGGKHIGYMRVSVCLCVCACVCVWGGGGGGTNFNCLG